MSPTEPLQQASAADWPQLPSRQWGDTLETLHMWTQIVGKVRMELSPWVNHSWSVPLYLNARGLTTSTIPYGTRTFEIDFDFVDHVLPIRASDGQTRSLALQQKSVAQFYHELLETLSEMGMDVSIHAVPNEIPEPIPFPEDEVHGTYDRFSGREAPEHPGGVPGLPDEIAREAYSHVFRATRSRILALGPGRICAALRGGAHLRFAPMLRSTFFFREHARGGGRPCALGPRVP